MSHIESTLSLEEWTAFCQDTVEPSAKQEIQKAALSGTLLIQGGTPLKLFIPSKSENGTWGLRPVVRNLEGVAKNLGLRQNNVHVMHKIDIHPIATSTSLLQDHAYFAVDDVESAVAKLVSKWGSDSNEAALELGITLASFETIASRIPFGYEGKYLKDFIESFRDEYLPRFMTWSNRSTLLRDFIASYNTKNDKQTPQLTPQTCDFCDHLASDKCINPTCTRGGTFVCLAHGTAVEKPFPSRGRRPFVICPNCVELAMAGQLAYKPLTGEWRVK